MTKPQLADIEKSFFALIAKGNREPGQYQGLFSKERTELYASLIDCGRRELMDSIYPGCLRLAGEGRQGLLDDYFDKYPPRNFHLNKIASKFPEYLDKFAGTLAAKFPFIAELADYEWIELEVAEDPATVKQIASEPITNPEQLASLAPVVNPTLVIRKYGYPIPKIVDMIGNDMYDFASITKMPVVMAVYRHPETNGARFLELGEVAQSVIETSLSGVCSYKDLISNCVMPKSSGDPQQAVIKFFDLVEQLESLGVVIGSQGV